MMFSSSLIKAITRACTSLGCLSELLNALIYKIPSLEFISPPLRCIHGNTSHGCIDIQASSDTKPRASLNCVYTFS